MTLLTTTSGELTISDSCASSPDLTTILTGLIGAIIGAAIALLANHISIREQRLRNLREQVVSFLNTADTLDVNSTSLRSAITNDNGDRIEPLVETIRTHSLEIDRHRQYIELIAHRRLREYVNDAHSEIRVLSGLALKLILQDDGKTIENTQPANYPEAVFTEHSNKYQRVRQAIVQNINRH